MLFFSNLFHSACVCKALINNHLTEHFWAEKHNLEVRAQGLPKKLDNTAGRFGGPYLDQDIAASLFYLHRLVDALFSTELCSFRNNLCTC